MSDFVLEMQGDTKDLLGKIKEASSRLDDFSKDTVNAVRAPQAELQRLAGSLQNFGSIAKTALAGVIGGLGLKSLTKDFMDYHSNLSNAVQVMGYDVTQVEALGGAMRRFGGDTTGAVSSLDSLSSALQQAKFGQGALLDVGAKFGISYMKSNGQLMNAEELLQSLSKQLNKYDKQTKVAIASQLGLDKALLRVIDSGNFDSMISSQKKLNTTTQQDLKIATDLESAWLDFKDSISAVAKEISRTLIPLLTQVMKWINSLIEYIRNFEHKAVLAWGAIGASIVPVIAKIKGTYTAIKSMGLGIKILEGVKVAVQGIALAAKQLFKPFNVVLLIVMAIVLVVEDLYTYFQGGDSIFGDLAKKFPLVKKFLDGLGAVIDTISTAVGRLMDFFENPTWDGFKDMVIDLAAWIKEKFTALKDWMVNLFKDAWKGIKNIGSDMYEVTKQKASEYGDKFLDWIGWSKKDKQLASTPTSALQGSNVNNLSNKTNNTEINITQNISGGNPNEIVEKTKEGVSQGQRKLMEGR